VKTGNFFGVFTMKRMLWQYPGDPVAVCVEMTRAEFLTAHPREPLRLIADGKVTECALGSDEIICDFCDADPGDTTYVLYNGLKGICPACFQRVVKPHLIHEG
jgi:hypothetical protein